MPAKSFSSEISKLLTKPEAIQMEATVMELLHHDSFVLEQKDGSGDIMSWFI